jgi:hypothetical protein
VSGRSPARLWRGGFTIALAPVATLRSLVELQGRGKGGALLDRLTSRAFAAVSRIWTSASAERFAAGRVARESSPIDESSPTLELHEVQLLGGASARNRPGAFRAFRVRSTGVPRNGELTTRNTRKAFFSGRILAFLSGYSVTPLLGKLEKLGIAPSRRDRLDRDCCRFDECVANSVQAWLLDVVRKDVTSDLAAGHLATGST